MLLLLLGQCTLVLPFVASDDPEVAMGAGMFGALLGLGMWLVWPVGSLALGLFAWLTRGAKVEVELPPG